MRITSYILALSICSQLWGADKIFTTNIQNVSSFEENSFIYALPRTCINLNFNSKRTVYISGPLAQHAHLLGLSDISENSSVKWTLLGVQCERYTEPDADHFYSVRGDVKGKAYGALMALPANSIFLFENGFEPGVNPSPCKPAITNSFIESKINLEFIADTAFNSVALSKKYVGAGSINEKAKAVADEILLIRQRLMNMAASEYVEDYPSAFTIDDKVEVLKKQEQELLSLFVGKTYTTSIKKSFAICPGGSSAMYREILFKFSAENGFLDAQAATGKAVVVVVNDLETTKYLKHLTISGTSVAKENTLIYRVPDKAEVNVILGSLPVLQMQMNISQMGAIVPHHITTTGK